MKEIYFAMNRHTKRADIIKACCWEHLQGMSRTGIVLGDGLTANGIGRCKSKQDFEKRAKHSGYNF